MTETTSANVYTVQQADLARDRETILDIWSRNLPAHTAEEHKARFQWHYMENPIPGSRIFLAHHGPTGKAIGTAGLGVRQIHFENRMANAGIAIDFTVEPQHRTLQPAILLERAVAASIDSGLDFVYGLPNDKARPVFKRIGYVEVGPLRRFVKVLDVGEFLRRRPLPGIVRGPLTFGGNMAQSALDLYRSGFRSAAEMSEIEWNDGRLETLWQKTSAPEVLLGDRRAGYLQWRFQRCPLHQHRILGLTGREGEALLGYAVVYGGDGGQLKVPDALIAPGFPGADALLALGRWAKEESFSSVAFEVVKPNEALLSGLNGAGFLERECGDVLFVLDKRAGSPAKSKPWYFLRGDEFYNTF